MGRAPTPRPSSPTQPHVAEKTYYKQTGFPRSQAFEWRREDSDEREASKLGIHWA